MKINTKVIHGYPMTDKYTGSSSIPLYQSSTYSQSNIEENYAYIYSRFSNPTRDALSEAICSIENAQFAEVFSSGMAAISAVLLGFSQGDHIVACKSIYGGTFQLMTEFLPRYGISVTFVDATDPKNYADAIQENTKAFYIETPSNPTLQVTDLNAVIGLAKKNNLITVCDNTFMTPLLSDVISLGIDFSINSATKFINGHSDVILGTVATNNAEYAKWLHKSAVAIGSIAAPFDSWLTMRGLKSMAMRVERSSENAQKLAEYLNQHSKVKKVFYPGLVSHPNHQVHMQQSKNGGMVVSFDLGNEKNVKLFLDAIRIPLVAVSLGGIESIISYPKIMSHACIPKEERIAQGVTDGLLRFSVGCEDISDLLADLDNALSTL
ncbi:MULTISPECIES: trans-sulfuration enzyme family protein [Providencia]|uniref:trans-sulfuration enzyme family protein n=1 Tax=Providencia TaxID=586 RepID=UPI0019814EF6|nr:MULTISPECIES: PLP-dependent aspartate aminotransferase family protein [Providencia]MBN4864050.1 PLP-dependent transferase [Providencia stuartii]MBN4873372.1 PLP-dependent transferase [Providencia stuartii]MBN4877507.1 PLP-dependent transferase [Providencia stuartii]MBN4882573.1 PLP-dependent transferase [Providencia stuartii]HEM8291864.1 PLP-dependent transferase [Providencia stuartii]